MSHVTNLSSGGGGGGSVTSVVTDSGTATPSSGVLNIIAGISTTNCGSSVEFTGSGNTVELNVTDANANTIIGDLAGANTTAPQRCVALGYLAMQNASSPQFCTAIGAESLQRVTGDFNTAIGFSAGGSITSGLQNCAIGESAMSNMSTGSNNIALGFVAGNQWSSSESSNIAIGHMGITGDNNLIRIGTSGSSAGQQNACFIAGIRGITTGNNNAVAVLVDSAGQLGTVSSSIRYKDNVKDMGSYSQDIMSLRPVTFTYKKDLSKSTAVGLIAEEVEKVMPHLVVYNDYNDDQPETVKYHDLVPMLLNELQKLRKEFDQYTRLRQGYVGQEKEHE